jgi:hypothetical protein
MASSSADTGAAWDQKGMLLLQLGGSPKDAASAFSHAVALRPMDPLFKKHLRDCEAPPTADPDADSGGDAPATRKKKKKKKKAASEWDV